MQFLRLVGGALGAALACFDEALGYSRQRIMSDKPIAWFQIPRSTRS